MPPALQNTPLLVSYYYAFASTIGAGGYDRRILKRASGVGPSTTVMGGGTLSAPPTTGTVTIADSHTYAAAAGTVNGIVDLTVASANRQRPLVGKPWTLGGSSTSSRLAIDGLLVSDGDLVIRGKFDTVTLTCCTLDPGSSGARLDSPAIFESSVANKPLRPSVLWIEGDLRVLQIERCIVGPIRARHGGSVETVEISDSIVQAIRTDGFGDLHELKDPDRMARRLAAQKDALSIYLWSKLTQSRTTITSYLAGGVAAPTVEQVASLMVADLNAVIKSGSSIYTTARFEHVALDTGTRALAEAPAPGTDYAWLNRVLLEAAYPTELADLAIGTTAGIAALRRCTVMGPAYLHRFEATECILVDRVTVEDAQHGCVRFSAWAAGSVLPRRYESVEIPAGAPIFTSDVFGDAGYGQLLVNADRRIIQPATPVGQAAPLSITQGGPTGSEMGAFAQEMNAIKTRSVLTKYDEFMPLGLSPVVVNVT